MSYEEDKRKQKGKKKLKTKVSKLKPSTWDTNSTQLENHPAKRKEAGPIQGHRKHPKQKIPSI